MLITPLDLLTAIELSSWECLKADSFSKDMRIKVTRTVDFQNRIFKLIFDTVDAPTPFDLSISVRELIKDHFIYGFKVEIISTQLSDPDQIIIIVDKYFDIQKSVQRIHVHFQESIRNIKNTLEHKTSTLNTSQTDTSNVPEKLKESSSHSDLSEAS